MRKKLIYNYWLVMAAWCMFLNDYIVLALLLCLSASVVLTTIKMRIDYIRVGLISIASYLFISIFLCNTNIVYYFGDIVFFLATLSVNFALANEYIYIYKVGFLKSITLYMTLALSVLSVIALILPNSQYTMFGKNNLYIVICLIFLPYLIPLINCLAYKKYRNHIKANFLKKKETRII